MTTKLTREEAIRRWHSAIDTKKQWLRKCVRRCMMTTNRGQVKNLLDSMSCNIQ